MDPEWGFMWNRTSAGSTAGQRCQMLGGGPMVTGKFNNIPYSYILYMCDEDLLSYKYNKRFEFKKLVGRLRPWKLESLGNRRY